MLKRQSNIDRNKVQIEKRITNLQERLKVKVPTSQIRINNHANQDHIERKVKHPFQISYKPLQQAKTQTQRNYNTSFSNTQNKFNRSKIEKKPQQKQNKTSRCYSYRETDTFDKIDVRKQRKRGQTINLDAGCNQNNNGRKQLHGLQLQNNKRLNEEPKIRFNYIAETSKTSQNQHHIKPIQNKQRTRYLYDEHTPVKIERKPTYSHNKIQNKNEYNEDLYKMIADLLVGQKTLQQQFHKFKQTYQNDLTLRTENSYLSAKRQHEKATNIQDLQKKLTKAEDYKQYYQLVSSFRQNQIKNQQKLFSPKIQQQNHTIIKKLREQSIQKIKPSVTFTHLPDESFERRSILKNKQLLKNIQMNKVKLSQPKPDSQYYKQVRQRYLYPHIQSNLLQNIYKSKEKNSSQNLTSKSVGIRKNNKHEKLTDIIKLVKQQNSHVNIDFQQDQQVKILDDSEQKYQQAQKRYNEIQHYMKQEQPTTKNIQKKLKQQLLQQIYHMVQGCTLQK